MHKYFRRFFLVFLLFLDTGYSLVQHLHMPVDGDFTAIVLPGPHYEKVLQNPLGIGVLTENEVYAAPNRFFVHWTLSTMFRNFPLFLQKITHPVDSVYLAIALSKTGIQLFLIGLLAFLISGGSNFLSEKFLLAAVLITPLFQTSGYYYHSMGVIEQSVTYTFFYALPVSLTLFFFLPFLYPKTWKWTTVKHLVWGSLTIILPLSGPLVPGIVLLGFLTLLIRGYFEGRKNGDTFIPGRILAYDSSGSSHWFILYFVMISLFSLYSLYIGRNNLENFSTQSIGIGQGFLLLPHGIVQVLFQKPGLPLIMLWVGLNSFLMRKSDHREKYFQLLKWFGLFTLLYLLLLPFGGYRDYRPLIIRRDTFLPLTLGMFFFFGYSSLLVLKNLRSKYRLIHITMVMVLLGVFTVADQPELDKNACEKEALELLSTTNEAVVWLKKDCPVMSWTPLRNPEYSESTARMLFHWRITKSVQLFYQE